MAIFQAVIQLIPRQWAEENPLLLYPEVKSKSPDASLAWVAYPPLLDFEPILGKILPSSKSWDRNLSCWGSDKTNDIQVWRNSGHIESVQIRLDLRKEIGALLSRIVIAATALDCVLWMPERNVIGESNVFSLKKILMESDAARFIKDPHVFLSELSLDDGSNENGST
jgi:hypothetical protein